jgi:hypothetical protein
VDHISVLYPDVDTPFVDGVDVMQRLLPYHVFQLPHEDIVTGAKVKGKGKASDHNSLDDIKGFYLFRPAAIKCYLCSKMDRDAVCFAMLQTPR